MESVVLKSKYGSTSFRRRTLIQHPDSRKTYYDMKEYSFDSENGFKATVPKQVWDELHDEYFDRKSGLKYREAFQTL